MTLVSRLAGAAALGAAMLGSGLFAPLAQAAYTVTLTQEGSNVVATGIGTIDTDGLRFITGGISPALMVPSASVIATGPASPSPYDEYTPPNNSGPASFGSGGATVASSGSGDFVVLPAFGPHRAGRLRLWHCSDGQVDL